MKKSEIIRVSGALGVLAVLYVLSRLIAIKWLPPFNDELIYVRWAQEGFFDASKRLLSLSDGKQPLFIWLTSLLMNVVPSPLAAGRLVSVAAGAAVAFGLYVFSWQLLRSRSVSFVASLLYILVPEAVLLDRFALYDSLLAALWIWCFVFMYRLVSAPSLGGSLVLALFLGAAMLTKSSAVLLIAALPFTFILCADNRKKLRSAAGYFLLSVGLSYVYQSVQQLSPLYQYIDEKNSVFAYPLRDVLYIPVAEQLRSNLPRFLRWIVYYLTVPVTIASFVPMADRKTRRVALFIWSLFWVLLLGISIVGKTVYPRHIFFLTVMLLVPASSGIVMLWRVACVTWKRAVLVILCFAPMTYLTLGMIMDFKSARLPAIDTFQYVEGWPAGWGVKEIMRHLEGEAGRTRLTILTEGTFGSLPTTAAEMYLGNYPQVSIIPVDDTTYAIPDGLAWDAPVYAILNKRQSVPEGWKSEIVMKISKGNGTSYIRLLRLTGP